MGEKKRPRKRKGGPHVRKRVQGSTNRKGRQKSVWGGNLKGLDELLDSICDTMNRMNGNDRENGGKK